MLISLTLEEINILLLFKLKPVVKPPLELIVCKLLKFEIINRIPELSEICYEKNIALV